MSLTRSASGLILYQDFEALTLGDISGQSGWITRLGTGTPNFDQGLGGPHTVVAGKYLQMTSGGYHRTQNETATALNQVIEARMRLQAADWMGLRWAVTPGVTWSEYAVLLKSGSTDGLYYVTGGTQLSIALDTAPTIVTNTWYRVRVKFTYSGGTRTAIVWIQDDALASPPVELFSGTVPGGPTVAGYPGVEVFNGGGVQVDWFSVYSSDPLTVTGLTGSQGFRVYNASDTVLASSAAQSGGSASVDLAAVLSSPFTGYIKVFEDAGTWATETPQGRYPAGAGTTATDLRHGDSYEFVPLVGAVYLIDFDDDGSFGHAHAAILGTTLCVQADHVVKESSHPSWAEGQSHVEFLDPDRQLCPTRSDSPVYPLMRRGLRIRIMESDGVGGYTPDSTGILVNIRNQKQKSGDTSFVYWQSWLGFLRQYGEVVVPLMPAGTAVYDATDAGTIAASALTRVLDLFQDQVPAAIRDIAAGAYGTLPEDWGGSMTLGAALDYLALVAQAWYRPVATLDSPHYWKLRWELLTAKASSPADLEFGPGDEVINDLEAEWPAVSWKGS